MWEIVKKNLDKHWEIIIIFRNVYRLVWNSLISNQRSDIQFNFYSVYSNGKSVTLDIIKNHPNIKWDYFALSSNPTITFEFVRKHQDECWNMYSLSIILEKEHTKNKVEKL